MAHPRHIRLYFAILLSLSWASPAWATATLRLSDGVNTVVIGDGSGSDGSSPAGVVSYAGSLGGSDTTYRITAGVTKPLIGSAGSPRFTLNDVTVIGGTGLLIIDFSETDFGPVPITTLFASIGGTTNSSVSYQVFADPGDQLFGLAYQVTDQGPLTASPGGSSSFGGALGGGDASGLLPGFANFSLTQRVIIQQSGATPDDTGFTATVLASPTTLNDSVPDGGSTLLLLGLAMLGLAGGRRLMVRPA